MIICKTLAIGFYTIWQCGD